MQRITSCKASVTPYDTVTMYETSNKQYMDYLHERIVHNNGSAREYEIFVHELQ